MGFAASLMIKLRTSLYDWANDYLLLNFKTNNYFDYQIIHRRWEQHLSGKNWVNL